MIIIIGKKKSVRTVNHFPSKFSIHKQLQTRSVNGVLCHNRNDYFLLCDDKGDTKIGCLIKTYGPSRP